MPDGFIAFELDLMGAVMHQLIPTLDQTESAPLTLANTQALPDKQGVYLLIHDDEICYVGKTDADAGLRTRLMRHVRKFEQRHNVKPSDVNYKAAQILVLTAMDVETKVIQHYRAEWNGSGFGSNDPGRNRETTNKPEQGFDTRFPVDIDVPVQILKPGTMTVHEALIALKEGLPYTLRYEVTLPPPRTKVGSHDYRLNPHSDMQASQVLIPPGSLTVRGAMKLIVSAMPRGWQATYFVSHIILYKENRTYLHGTVI